MNISRPRRMSLAFSALLLLGTPVLAATPTPGPALSATPKPQMSATPAALAKPTSSPVATAAPNMTAAPKASPTPVATASSHSAPMASASSLPTPHASAVPGVVYPSASLQDARAAADQLVIEPQKGHLKSGLRYILQPTGTTPVTSIDLWFRTPSTGFATLPMPSIAHFSAETIAASAIVGGDTLSRYVQNLGGSFTIDVSPDSVKVSVVAPSAVAPQIVAALTKSYFAPKLDIQGYKAAAFDLSTQALLNRLDAYVTVNDSLLAALFSDGPEHYPTLDELSLTRISFASLQAYAQRAFRLDNALLVVSGAVDSHILDAASDATHRGDGPEGASNSTIAPQPSEHIIESIVPAAGIGWVGPSIHDDMAATAMDFLADYLFNDRGGLLTTQFAEIAPNVSLSGQFVTFRKPGVFLVTLLGDSSDRFLPAIEAQVHAMAKPMDAAAFAVAREAYISRIEMSQNTPQGLAASLGWYDLEGNGDYAPGAFGESGKYIRDAWALTPESVAAVAKQYLTAPAAHVRLLSLPGRKAVL